MCGLTGILNFGDVSEEQLVKLCSRMTDSLSHRGPDDRGLWIAPNCDIALGHRRLSILDLSPEGHQPMLSVCGRYAIVYNGEVYNYLAIQDKLEKEGKAPVFRGHSDTEVILAAISAWGIKKAVLTFNGIFAFALWDQKERELSLVRDRVGVKPMYYGWAGKSLVFGSELKALRRHQEFDKTIDKNSLALYFRHNYIPAPYSIYEKAFKLEPGHILKIRPTSANLDKRSPLKSEAYWSARDVWLNGATNPFQGDEIEAVNELENLLKQAVGSQMLSDVPLGTFLSGGIDSSTVTALMQSQSQRPVKTFSIGFLEAGYNEAVFAKRIANYLGTQHSELYVTDKQAQDIIPLLPQVYDEPFADSSQIPTCLISKLAREQVTVSLSGDGGDELFCGYNNYMSANRLWNNINVYPRCLRKLFGILIDRFPIKMLDVIGYPLNILLRLLGYSTGRVGERLKIYGCLLSQSTPTEHYFTIASYFSVLQNPVVAERAYDTIFVENVDHGGHFDYFQSISLLDILMYLPDDILVKVDRASMATALEVRVPILDHYVVEFASTLPTNMKVKNRSGKLILKKLLNKYIPFELTERPKMGFGVPVGDWLRGPLHEWASDLLDEELLKQEGFLDSDAVSSLWVEHVSMECDRSYVLWGVLMFQSWLRNGLR